MTIGKYPLHPGTIIKILLSKIFPIQQSWSESDEIVVILIRIPRTLGVLLVGASLSCAGASFQGTFQNPLVSEHILGTATSAGFGVALAIYLGFQFSFVSLFAFCFGLFGMVIVLIISKSFKKTNQTLIIVLTGVVISSLFSSFISLIKYVMDPYDKLPSLIYWLMGSFTRVKMSDIIFTLPIMSIGLILLISLSWKLNVLSIGDEEASSLGINTQKLRYLIIIFATLITAASVSISGIVGWIGLVIPHITRMLFGSNHQKTLRYSAIIGAQYLLFVDILCRTLTPGEIPIGILTSIIGVPIFIYLLKKTRLGFE